MYQVVVQTSTSARVDDALMSGGNVMDEETVLMVMMKQTVVG